MASRRGPGEAPGVGPIAVGMGTTHRVSLSATTASHEPSWASEGPAGVEKGPRLEEEKRRSTDVTVSGPTMGVLSDEFIVVRQEP